MKKAQRLLSLLVSFIMVAGLLPSAVFSADAEVAVSEANFPDDIFRNYVSEKFDKDKDGSLSANEIADVREISVSGLGIADLAGVEYFTNLTELYCEKNQLTALDVSKNTALEFFYVAENKLTEIDLSKNIVLRDINFSENQMTELDVSNNPLLYLINCDKNQLTELDLSNNNALELLWCQNNQLTSLKFGEGCKLMYLDCGYNKLTELDLSNARSLEYLWCPVNELTELDLSNNLKLSGLDCEKNQLTWINFGENTVINSLQCNYNCLPYLDISANTSLTKVFNLNNFCPIEISDDRTFDLTTLPGSFDVNKASKWSGGTVSGNILTVNEDTAVVHYKYDCGGDGPMSFALFSPLAFCTEGLTPGDADGDGKIGLKDVSRMIRYIADWQVDIDIDNADVENDGRINLMDVSLIVRYLAGWDYIRLGHEDQIIDWITPSCTEGGETRIRCLRCGDVEIFETDPLGHNFVDGKCTRCKIEG